MNNTFPTKKILSEANTALYSNHYCLAPDGEGFPLPTCFDGRPGVAVVDPVGVLPVLEAVAVVDVDVLDVVEPVVVSPMSSCLIKR